MSVARGQALGVGDRARANVYHEEKEMTCTLTDQLAPNRPEGELAVHREAEGRAREGQQHLQP